MSNIPTTDSQMNEGMKIPQIMPHMAHTPPRQPRNFILSTSS